jgi:inositol-phosphate transport system substrate-binding protein
MRNRCIGMLLLVAVLILVSCGGASPSAPAGSAGTSGAQPAATAAPAAGGQQADATAIAPPSKGDKTAISVWAQANNVETYRAKNIETAAQKLGLTAEAIADPTGWGDYKKKFLLAADSGQAPDIILSGHEDIAPWGKSGYIIPLDDMISANQDAYKDIFPELWKSVTWNGKRWGIPQDTEARPLFYNKKKLADLGWSQQEIDSLPDRIKSGEFTLDDMIATAKQAVDKGVVKKGYGYWHRTTKGSDFYQYYFAYGGTLADESGNKLVFDKAAAEKWFAFQRRVVEEGITPEKYIGTEAKIWHETVTSGDVLFWNGGVWQFADWAKNYVKDKGGEDYLYGFIGWSLQPTGMKGQPGVTLSHPLVYMVTSDKASGEQQQQDAFKAITAATTPELNNLHALGSTHLAILKTQLNQPDYAANKLLQGTAYMLDFTRFLPNNPDFGTYDEIVFRIMTAAENGEMTPQQAVQAAADELQTELGDKVVIK